jgi:hypothetical protein
LQDLESLMAAIATLGGDGSYVFIGHPRQCAAAQLRLGRDKAQTFWATRALADGTVVCLQPNAFVASFARPRVTAAIEAVLHMASPASEVVADDTTVAKPVRSVFQSDCIAIRILLPVAFVMRAPLIAMMNSCTWGLTPGP